MKIKHGFISNSSSTSFILIGKIVEFNDIDINKIDNIIITGEELCEGIDIFNMTIEIYDYINSNRNLLQKFTFMNVEHKMEDESFITKDILISAGSKIEIVNIDYYSTTSFNEFIEKYDN